MTKQITKSNKSQLMDELRAQYEPEITNFFTNYCKSTSFKAVLSTNALYQLLENELSVNQSDSRNFRIIVLSNIDNLSSILKKQYSKEQFLIAVSNELKTMEFESTETALTFLKDNINQVYFKTFDITTDDFITIAESLIKMEKLDSAEKLVSSLNQNEQPILKLINLNYQLMYAFNSYRFTNFTNHNFLNDAKAKFAEIKQLTEEVKPLLKSPTSNEIAQIQLFNAFLDKHSHNLSIEGVGQEDEEFIKQVIINNKTITQTLNKLSYDDLLFKSGKELITLLKEFKLAL